MVAFWNREGAYQTKAQAYTNWNEEIIKGMLDDIQGLEDGFLTESESIFGTMRNSAHQGLDWLVRHNGRSLGQDIVSAAPTDINQNSNEWITSVKHFLDGVEISIMILTALLTNSLTNFSKVDLSLKIYYN